MMTFSLTIPTIDLNRNRGLKGSVSVKFEVSVAFRVFVRGKLVAISSLRSFLLPGSF